MPGLAAAVLAAACSDPARPDPAPPVERGFVRLHLSAPAPPLWEVTGPIVRDVNGEPDLSRNWVALRSAILAGKYMVTHAIRGNLVEGGPYPPGTFQWYVNPGMTRVGTFRPGDCPSYPPSYQNCAWIRLALGHLEGPIEAEINAIPDSVTMTITEYGTDQIRASFSGRFTYVPAVGTAAHIDVTGDVEVAR
jgi:hypothetical protein